MNGNPCGKCPFRRTSVKGYLGAATGDPEAFLSPYLESDLKIPCHIEVNWDAESEQEIVENTESARVCKGFAIMCKNTAKLPMNRDNAEATTMAVRDTLNVFSNVHEFLEYHKQ